MSDNHCLAVGTSLSYVRIYDIRMEPATAEVISIPAHLATRPRKIKGIKQDPFHPSTIATFSDSAMEPVKIWDLRKGNSGITKPKITINPHEFSPTNESGSSVVSLPPVVAAPTSQSVVVDISWSSSRSNLLAVATTSSRYIQFYSTFKSSPESNTRTPVHSIQVNDNIKSISWQNESTRLVLLKDRVKYEETQLARPLTLSLTEESVSSHHKLLVATNIGISQVMVVESVGLGLGRDAVLSASGASISLSPLTIGEDQAMSSHLNVADIDKIMQDRCRSGYALDAGRNIQVLYDELDALTRAYNTANGVVVKSSTISLLGVWNWLYRVEALHAEELSLSSCGIMKLVEAEKSNSTMYPSLGTAVYLSSSRSKARMICGWSEHLHGVHLVTDNTHNKDSHIDPAIDIEDSLEDDGNDVQEINEIVNECCQSDSFERAAALALWHGNLELCLLILQSSHTKIIQFQESAEDKSAKGSPTPQNASFNGPDEAKVPNNYTSQSLLDELVDFEDDDDKRRLYANIDTSYLHIVSLVAMCVAGYSVPTPSSSKGSLDGDVKAGMEKAVSGAKMWCSMCQVVLKEIASCTQRPTSCYLESICRFLLINMQTCWPTLHGVSGSSVQESHKKWGPYGMLLEDIRVSPQDRIGFACTFIEDSATLAWLRELCNTARMEGSLEGLVVTGLSTDGIAILQKFVDNTNDIQSAALIVGRIVDAKETEEVSGTQSGKWQLHTVWLNEYRNLLNRWRMFFERASLDVELGKSYRQHSSNHSKQLAMTSSGAKSVKSFVDKKSGGSATRQLYSLPAHRAAPHVYLRCHYCSTSLPVDPMQQNQTTLTFLRKQRPVINCCSHCKKQLPRCYVCLLYMGVVNPNAEFNRAMAARRLASESVLINKGDVVTDQDKAVEHNALEFGQWFFFCQRCRHGGHAVCIESWFARTTNTHVNSHQHSQHILNHSRNTFDRNICGVSGCQCNCQALN